MLLAVLMANLLYPTVLVIVTEIDYGPFKDLRKYRIHQRIKMLEGKSQEKLIYHLEAED